MFAALQVLYPRDSVGLHARSHGDLAIDVRRDQIYEASATDPLFGAPVITSVDYAR
jgi:hypothetical protein